MREVEVSAGGPCSLGEAVDEVWHAVQMKEKAMGCSHPEVASSLRLLGRLEEASGSITRARELLCRAARIYSSHRVYSTDAQVAFYGAARLAARSRCFGQAALALLAMMRGLALELPRELSVWLAAYPGMYLSLIHI